MHVTNHHRKALTALEETDALFAASASEASKTRIRKATGLGREVAAGFGHSVALEQLALQAEFEDDTRAVDRIMNDICGGRSGQHAAEQIRQERAEAAEHKRLVAQLIADGYTLTEQLPPNPSCSTPCSTTGRNSPLTRTRSALGGPSTSASTSRCNPATSAPPPKPTGTPPVTSPRHCPT